jgi:hypothetical protein
MSEGISILDVPPEQVTAELRRCAFDEVWLHTASLLGADREGRPEYLGTGTLVSVHGPSILTAAHVWRELDKWTLIGLTTGDDHWPVWIRRDLLRVRFVSSASDPEWGPDLALVALPDVKANELRVRKSFYDLDRRRAEALAGRALTESGMWGVVGVAAEQGEFREEDAIMPTTLFVAGILSSGTRGDLDYLDLAARRDGRPDLPRSYGGLSGSGLWRFELGRGVEGELSLVGRPSLEGVAFFQGPAQEESFIRCHGRDSVYRWLLDRAA